MMPGQLTWQKGLVNNLFRCGHSGDGQIEPRYFDRSVVPDVLQGGDELPVRRAADQQEAIHHRCPVKINTLFLRYEQIVGYLD
jgi:hypothetical protein